MKFSIKNYQHTLFLTFQSVLNFSSAKNTRIEMIYTRNKQGTEYHELSYLYSNYN